MNNSKNVNVFFASDERYLPYLSVALVSLSEHASDEYIYNIKILSEGFSDESLDATRAVLKENIKVEAFDVSEKIESVKAHLELRLRDYYSVSIYYRMFIPSMFPELERAVYLDSDIVLLDDVARLYFTDIGKSLVGAVTDESVVGVPVFCDYVKRQIGIGSAEEYFNSGVLLMNLSEMREAAVEKTFLYLLRTYNFNTVAPDQDYLNLLCRGKVYYFDGGWNKHAIPGSTIPEGELHLLHFNMFNKPWHYYDVPYESEFWRFAEKSPFAKELLDGRCAYTNTQRNADADGARKLVLLAEQIYETGISMSEICESIAAKARLVASLRGNV